MAIVSTDSSSTKPSLTNDQELIALAPCSARLLVTAGAGTGKTYTLIHRVSFLVNEENLSPGSEILLLTFSRAAAREIRDRLRLTEGRSRYVHVATFDSFATRILSAVSPSGDWSTADYDGRIQAATRLVLDQVAEALDFLRSYRHVLIDELQDLVGLRAELVKAIIDRADGGWTLFGDPAQAIYSFQVPEEKRAEADGSFQRWLKRRFSTDLQELTLEGNHRAKTSTARLALAVGPLLNQPRPDFGLAYGRLIDVLRSVPSVQDLPEQSPVIPALRRADRSTAILCRNNGQALIVSERLRRQGLPHRVQGPATDRALAPWLAILLGRFQSASVGKRLFLQACDGIPDIEPEKAWTLLKRTEGDRSPTQLNLQILTARIRNGCVLDELVIARQESLVISTIHRSKGLEFDRVIIVEPLPDDMPDEDGGFPDEVRLLYVALTRAKSEILHMNSPKSWYLRRTATSRWYRCGNEAWKRLGIELRPDDIEHLYPAGVGADALAAQKYLALSVRPGDSLALRKRTVMVDGQPRVYYSVFHKETEIGATNQNFTRELLIMYGSKPTHWPEEISNVFVDGVDSVAGSNGVAQKCHIGWADVWLRVRVCGLGKFSYEKL